MDTISYQAVNENIHNKLLKVNGSLPPTKIEEEITKIRNVITAIGAENFANILSIDSYTDLSEEDWARMATDFEIYFNVKLSNGTLIQGEEQQDRDTVWWSTLNKQKSLKYYWPRYADYLATTLPPDVVKTIDEDTDIILDNIENPTVSSFSRYGMVVGHVQSGKTGNYAAIVCKAADAGYKFIVVIAGDKNNLRNQTQERLNESFIGQSKGVQVGAGKGNSKKEMLPYSLTTVEKDFNKHDADKVAQGLNFDNISVPILMVIKKNSGTLKNVIDWLQKQYVNKIVKHAMLVIDDESDYASINTREESDPTIINKRLRTLIGLFQKSAYIAFTATPYANIFIDHKAESADLGRDLFPKDFIYALDAPTNYFGARRIFLETERKSLVAINDWTDILPLNHKKDLEIDHLPGTLLEALRLFLLVVVIRNLRGQGNKHNSMLIHASRFTDVHKKLAKQAASYLTNLTKDITSYGKLPDALDQSLHLQDLKSSLEKYYKEIEFNWKDILLSLTDIIDSVIVREVHQKTTLPLIYRNDAVTNAIVIGGTSLARGFTVEGLSISYFLRSTVFWDTLLQMGRWFGYRPGYEDLCRIFMPADRIEDFAEIISSTEDLYKDFKLMAEKGMTPNDFGLSVQENPDNALQVTARNKQKNVTEYVHSLKLDGRLKETSRLRSDPADIKKNIDLVKLLMDSLAVSEPVEGSRIWKNVDRKIIGGFLKKFKTFENDRLGLTSRMPLPYIEKFTEERDINWDVSLHNGTGAPFIHKGIEIKREKRQFTYKKEGFFEIQNRQVSSGSAESIGIADPELRKKYAADRGETRKNLPRPLLMLHIIEPTFNKNGEPTKEYGIDEIVAIGASFPGDVTSKEDIVTLKINTVYYQNLLRDLELDQASDD
ncbi:Z1 domain-containing protein [Mucilaginibacter sp.]|uniref:Z1 domain-containing protein n=1 Tax=Mucilaginibacter sp. TaxID=1882438 RepID=UPI003AFF8210